jgi:L-lactate dehydrogenase complex protein LldG
MNREDLTALFTENAEAVSAKVKPMASLDEAMDYAVAIAKQAGPPIVAAPGWGDAVSEKLGLKCVEAGLEFQTQDMRQKPNDIAVGFTSAQYGLAETGTLVIDSASEDLRLATMLSQIHVAVLDPARICRDMQALEQDLQRRMDSPPSYMAFITGASRTADIERVLTIGVHGPVELHILLTGEAAA